jgi:hypothetical protein
MNKTKIIIFSVLIILTFGILFIVNEPNDAPESEVNEELFSNFKGKKGFTVITLPNFLIKQLIENNDSTGSKLNTSSNQKFILMIFHDEKSPHSKQDSIKNNIITYLNEGNFKHLSTDNREYGMKHLYSKPYENKWRESVVVFTSDSSLFVFSLINKLSTNEIKSIASTLEKERTSFE